MTKSPYLSGEGLDLSSPRESNTPLCLPLALSPSCFLRTYALPARSEEIAVFQHVRSVTGKPVYRTRQSLQSTPHRGIIHR